MTAPPPLKAIVIENEGIVLLELELVLGDLGYDVVGRAGTLESGVLIAREAACDVAVVDIDLCGRESGPIADVLNAREVPFIFVTGYTNSSLPDRHAHRPLVAKPFSIEQVSAALRLALSQRA